MRQQKQFLIDALKITSLPALFGQFSSLAEDASAKEVPNKAIDKNVLCSPCSVSSTQKKNCRGVESNAFMFMPRISY